MLLPQQSRSISTSLSATRDCSRTVQRNRGFLFGGYTVVANRNDYTGENLTSAAPEIRTRPNDNRSVWDARRRVAVFIAGVAAALIGERARRWERCWQPQLVRSLVPFPDPGHRVGKVCRFVTQLLYG